MAKWSAWFCAAINSEYLFFATSSWWKNHLEKRKATFWIHEWTSREWNRIRTDYCPGPAKWEWRQRRADHESLFPKAWQMLAGHRDHDIVFYPISADPTCQISPLISMISSVFRSHPSSSVGFKKIVFLVPCSILGDRSWARIFMGSINVTAF